MKETDFSRLEKNVMEVVKEEQIKLGYQSEVIRLYYPLQSLNRFLNCDQTSDQMQTTLECYFNEGKSTLGKVQVSNEKERFCLVIPRQTVDFIYEHKKNQEFIEEFIRTIVKHGCTIEELYEVFLKYSNQVHFEKMEHGEFDYLLYFKDGVPDDYRYCITDEGCHMIYHRFTPEDYEDLDLTV